MKESDAGFRTRRVQKGWRERKKERKKEREKEKEKELALYRALDLGLECKSLDKGFVFSFSLPVKLKKCMRFSFIFLFLPRFVVYIISRIDLLCVSIEFYGFLPNSHVDRLRKGIV